MYLVELMRHLRLRTLQETWDSKLSAKNSVATESAAEAADDAAAAAAAAADANQEDMQMNHENRCA